LEFNRDIATELIDFGKYLFGSSSLKFVILQGDDAFVGWYLSAGTLGIYQMAYRISNLVATEIANVITDVTFPMYSKIQDESDELNERFTQASQLSTIVAYPLTGGLILLAPEITRTVLGYQWIAMVPVMRILAILGALKSVGYDSIFKGIGRPDFVFKSTVVRVILIAVTIYPLTVQYGVVGTAASVVIATAAVEILSWYFLSKIGYPVYQLLKVLVFPIIATVCMVGGIVLTNSFFSLNDIGTIAVFVPLGAIIYATIVYIEDRLIGSYRGWLLVEQLFKNLLSQ
jgi:O-antigen/teichoic acid export membrane protein